MGHIIVNFQPFVVEQEILVYTNGECVYQAKVEIDRVPSVVKGLKNKFNIDKIDLCGNSQYLSRFKAELGSEFDNDETEITIYQR